MAIKASELTLEEVSRLLKFEERFDNSISSWLTLEPLTDFEQQELLQIQTLYRHYYKADKILEGQIKFLFVARLMWLAGFYQPEIEITLEEDIAEISVEDEDRIIKGRMDILAVNRTDRKAETRFWILVIETKNSSVNAMEGLPQLLTYAYKSLEHQDYVWGLTTNGMIYQFVYIQQGSRPTYTLIPDLNLTYSERASQLLQVLKAIRKQQNTMSISPVIS